MSEIILENIEGLETSIDISSTEANVETGSSNPVEFATENPAEASAWFIGAVAIGLGLRWLNDRTARDQDELKRSQLQ
jgi:F0F1-type ATP synthase assembly protein I